MLHQARDARLVGAWSFFANKLTNCFSGIVTALRFFVIHHDYVVGPSLVSVKLFYLFNCRRTISGCLSLDLILLKHCCDCYNIEQIIIDNQYQYFLIISMLLFVRNKTAHDIILLA